jgi:hypothetical protein
MIARGLGCLSAIALAMLIGLPPLWSAPPWSKMAMFKHLEADPEQMYPISENSGPWMIMATTFTGEGAEEQARKLVHELRREFKLQAYSYQKKFEYSKPVTGKGRDAYGEPLKMRYSRHDDIVEIAVLIGDYPTVDDPEGQKILKKIKYLQPKTLAVDTESTNQSLAMVRSIQKQVKQKLLPADSDELKRGPMAGAFMINNPYLPNEYFVPKGIDKLVLEMNKGVTHSLLDCPKRYTVKVATFTGHAILLDQKTVKALENGGTPKSWLEDAAKNAHILTEALRLKNWEAYEFHDRNSSIVTVGSFDSVGTPRQDGKIEINPQVHKIMKTFGVETKLTPGKAPEVGKPKKVAGIPLDVQPMAVEVPRRNISADYGRTAELREKQILR